MDSRGQVSIEMLLLIGAAVAVAAIVGIYLKTVASHRIIPAGQNQLNETLHAFG